jgi:lipopolysaccharide export system protein LptA
MTAHDGPTKDQEQTLTRRTLRPVLLAGGATLLLAALAGSAVLARAHAGGAVRADTIPRPGGLPGDTIPRLLPGQPASPARTDSARAGRDTVPARPDSLYDALLKLRGYTPVEYRGDSAEFAARERVLRLRGDAEVTREGTKLTAADSIVYREQSRFVEAYGSPTATGEGENITGNVMFYDLQTRRATVQGARTKITDRATWLVQGNVTSEAQTRLYASNSTFTSDDREDPAYHFKADEIKIIRNRILVGRPAYLYFKNVPVMYLPFIVQDLSRGRRSGLLVPRFDINDIVRTRTPGRNSLGTGRTISNLGYYFAINDYMGASTSFEWRSGAYKGVQGALEYNWRRQFLNGNFTVENIWETEGPQRLNLVTSNTWKPNERTDLALTANYAASSDFERRRASDPDRTVANLASNLSASRRFDWGSVNVTGERRQSLANGDVEMTLPNLGLTFNPITLFPAADPTRAHFWNDAVLTISGNGSRATTRPGDALLVRKPNRDQTNAQLSQSLRLSNLSFTNGFTFAQTASDALAAIDSARAAPSAPRSALGFIPAQSQSRIQWTAAASYQVDLIASTYIAPSISLSRDWVKEDSIVPDIFSDSAPQREAFGRYVAGPTRLNLGASLNTDLYGFFPGVGPYSAIRHHLKPGLRYTYSPEIRQSLMQEAVFGSSASREINEITLSLDQTFEAKLKDPSPAERQRESGGPRTPADTAVASLRGDSVNAAGNPVPPPAAPSEPRKVTILAINTSALAYSFVPREPTLTDFTQRRFLTDDLTNTIRSDYFGGLNFSVGHDLFREVTNDSGRVVRREFSPYLTSLSTSFQFGANSALFRFLGLGRRDPSQPEQRGGGVQADSAEQREPIVPPGSGAFTGNPQRTGGGGDWNLQLRYSLSRSRPPAVDSLRRAFDPGNQDLSGTLSFYPTKNWGVNWTTSYSITDGTFTQQQLTFTRDLYRWQANFGFFRTATGNTTFTFRVNLIDLPDLKFDYREQNLGADRATPNNTF